MVAQKIDYYEVLGVAKDATDAELRVGYRTVLRNNNYNYNRDNRPASEIETAEKNCQQASEAYGVLSDPAKRAKYDRYRHPGISGAGHSSGGPIIGTKEFVEDFIANFVRPEGATSTTAAWDTYFKDTKAAKRARTNGVVVEPFEYRNVGPSSETPDVSGEPKPFDYPDVSQQSQRPDARVNPFDGGGHRTKIFT